MFKRFLALSVLAVSLVFAAGTAAKGLVLFQCDFTYGGSVQVTRDAHDVTMVIAEKDGSKETVSNPLDETGVGSQKAVGVHSIDFLDLLQGDKLYSVVYQRTGFINKAYLLTMVGDTAESQQSCVIGTTINNLQDPAATAGIFRP